MRAVIVALLALLFVAPGFPAAAESPVTITSQNVKHTLAPWQARHDIAQAAEHSSLLALQEMGGRQASRYRPAGWDSAQPVGRPSARRECPVMWLRQDWSLRRYRVAVLARSSLFPSATRYAAVYVLRNAAGYRAAVVCVHLIPHVELRGWPRRLPRRHVIATEVATVAGMARQLAARYRLVLVAGDWNVDYRADSRVRYPTFPWRRMRAAGFRAMWDLGRTRPTLGRRWVDTVWMHGARPVHVRTVTGTYSDHNGARVRVSFPAGH